MNKYLIADWHNIEAIFLEGCTMEKEFQLSSRDVLEVERDEHGPYRLRLS
jgi:hypothetical protein